MRGGRQSDTFLIVAKISNTGYFSFKNDGYYTGTTYYPVVPPRVRTCCLGGDVVWNAEEISAGGPAYPKLDGDVIVAFLFDNVVVVYDFVAVPAFLGNEGVRDRYDGS
jgi:hypothetical protein